MEFLVASFIAGSIRLTVVCWDGELKSTCGPRVPSFQQIYFPRLSLPYQVENSRQIGSRISPLREEYEIRNSEVNVKLAIATIRLPHHHFVYYLENISYSSESQLFSSSASYLNEIFRANKGVEGGTPVGILVRRFEKIDLTFHHIFRKFIPLKICS